MSAIATGAGGESRPPDDSVCSAAPVLLTFCDLRATRSTPGGKGGR